MRMGGGDGWWGWMGWELAMTVVAATGDRRCFFYLLASLWAYFESLWMDPADSWIQNGHTLGAIGLYWSRRGHFGCLQAPFWEGLGTP